MVSGLPGAIISVVELCRPVSNLAALLNGIVFDKRVPSRIRRSLQAIFGNALRPNVRLLLPFNTSDLASLRSLQRL
jgi:hypothetical protein